MSHLGPVKLSMAGALGLSMVFGVSQSTTANAGLSGAKNLEPQRNSTTVALDTVLTEEVTVKVAADNAAEQSTESIQKYSWSNMLYKVDATADPAVSALTEEQWLSLGAPEVKNVPWIEGTTLYKNAGSEEVFAVAPGVTHAHKLTAEEFTAMGERNVELRSGSFVKTVWDDTVYFTDPALGSDYYVAQTVENLADQGEPAPVVVDSIPGSFFYSVEGQTGLYYYAAGLEKPVTEAQWLAAGSPEIKVIAQ